jgi:hypothetical protein
MGYKPSSPLLSDRFADKAGLYYRFLPRYVWSNLFEPKQEHP